MGIKINLSVEKQLSQRDMLIVNERKLDNQLAEMAKKIAELEREVV